MHLAKAASFAGLGLILAVTLIADNLAQAQGGSARERQDFENSRQALLALTSDLETKIKSATAALDEVANMEDVEQEQTINEFFNSMKEQVTNVLDQLGPNSSLMDAMERAKSKTIVLKKWFERQNENYPNRDKSIMRLETAITDYDAVAEQMRAGRSSAQDQLRTLARNHFVIQQELKIGRAENGVRMAREVVQSLSRLTDQLAQIAAAQLPEEEPAVSN